jgi:hypothetical protein
MNENYPLGTMSANKTLISDKNNEYANTLGLEKHVRHIFLQTQNTITSLNNELDDQKKINEDLSWKLNDLNQQKNTL